jgi:RNA polymerase sigma-70 factor (ECF subfamily)
MGRYIGGVPFAALWTEDMENNKKLEEITSYWTQAQPAVAAFISTLVQNYEDANDVLQSVAMVIVRKYDNYDKKFPFTAWAIGIARNEVLHYRRKMVKDRHVFDDELLNMIAQTYQENVNELEDIKKVIDGCISRVQRRWQQILQMRYLQGMEVKQIARFLGISGNAVFLILHRLRLSLRDCVLRSLKHQGV